MEWEAAGNTAQPGFKIKQTIASQQEKVMANSACLLTRSETKQAASKAPLAGPAAGNVPFTLAASHVLWFGIGTALLSDSAETILHCPHLLAVALYASLMISSTWFGIRPLLVLGICIMPAILSGLYFGFIQPLTDEGLLALWTQMLRMKSIEYASGILIVVGSLLHCTSKHFDNLPTRESSPQKANHRTKMACLGIGLGNALMILSDFNYASSVADSQADLTPILGQCGSSLLGLCLLGLVLGPSKNSLNDYSRRIAARIRIPLRLLILVVGTLAAVYFEWCKWYTVGWPQYVGLCVPPLILLVVSNFYKIKRALYNLGGKLWRLTALKVLDIIPHFIAPVAQLDRVPGFEPGGREFESLRAHQ